MPRKIEQEELNRLIAENASSIEINLRQLLENHGYNLDISERYFDCKILDDSGRELNFSGLNLTNSTFIDLEALSVSFADSNLTNASIKFKSVAGTDFSRADLTRCYINKIEAMSNNFTDAIINDTMIFKKFERDGSFFSPSQAAKIISLEIAPADSFRQIDMIRKYSSDLPQEGFCLGGGVELARHALKAIDRGENPEQSSFTDKLTRKMANRSENFLKRVYDYQKQLFSHEKMTIIKNKKVEDNDFIAALDVKFDNSNLISCWVTYGNKNEYHVFTVIKLRNSGGEVKGYRIFDLNFGEIRCDQGSISENEKKCNQQVNLLYKHYKDNTTDRNKWFTVTDLDKIIQDYGLVKPKNKYKKSDKYLDKIVPSRGVEDIIEPESKEDQTKKGYGTYISRLLSEWFGATGSSRSK